MIHAASLGEAILAASLIKQLRIKHPDIRILLTTATLSGSRYVRQYLIDLVQHVYLPIHSHRAMRRLLTSFQPKNVCLIETELWPSLLALCHQHTIPVHIINGRMSEKSMKKYQRVSRFFNTLWPAVASVCAQTDADAARFISLGLKQSKVHVMGQLKFDAEIDKKHWQLAASQHCEHWPESSSVWIAASTHAEEEAIALRAHKALLDSLSLIHI